MQSRSSRVVLCIMGATIILGAIVVVHFRFDVDLFNTVPSDFETIQTSNEASYTDLDGVSVSLRDFAGKPVLIYSWATWSPFTQQDFLILSEIERNFGTALHIIAINRMEQVPMIRGYLSLYPLPSSVRILLDPTDHFYSTISGYAMPEAVLYNESGEMVEHIRGSLSYDVLVDTLSLVQ